MRKVVEHFRCDRCGTEQQSTIEPDLDVSVGGGINLQREVSGEYVRVRLMDLLPNWIVIQIAREKIRQLCPECTAKFRRFMAGEELPNGTV